MLTKLGRRLDGLHAIVVVSPHWHTRGLRVSAAAAPETIHDFGGFPRPLYALQYNPPGAPALARDIVALLGDAGFVAQLDDRRGLDHGAWVPLRYLQPDANVPVLQVSLPQDLDTEGALRLGRALSPLRERGVLIIGSGSMTHNLFEFRQHLDDPEYAQDFADWIGAAVSRHDVEGLVRYRERAPHASRAHPTEEHYLPLLVALGAADPEEGGELLAGGMTDGILSMDSFVWGGPSLLRIKEQ
jgi:4,5-DOPA dioxygenase extradiol